MSGYHESASGYDNAFRPDIVTPRRRLERTGHHVIYTAREWNLRPEGKSIRDTKGLIVGNIYRDDHEEIHKNCPAIPLLGHQALLRVRRTFVEGNSTLQSMENLMRSISEAGRQTRAHPIETQLADLAVQAIDLQRPYVKRIESNRK